MKVPSCDLHNSNKSGDDQYMMVYFAARAKGLDYEKLRPHIDKTVKTILRKPHFLSEYTDQIKIVPKVDGQPYLTNVDWHNPQNHIELKSNYERIGNFLAAVARGVLFYDKGIQWEGAVLVLPHFLGTLETDDGASITTINEIMIDPNFSTGDNQEIFFYRTKSHDNNRIKHIVDMCFYNEMKATCLFMPREMRAQVEDKFVTANFVRWVDYEPSL
ncbi:hypothetical protein [Pseudomonas sp. FH1]|uniref:hypothetical protein n=1 Tax=Pseudomonas sp. FH1 TaxID=1284392 RepID=UPI0003DDC814|nr:hypothetical protein [Pseudomonas sp. FH1]ETK24514.1 hypothetical protein H096_05197 [Pseudomonas sp. FH1]